MYNYIRPYQCDSGEEMQIKAANVAMPTPSNEREERPVRNKEHVHEYTGSAELAAPTTNLLHNHRFSGITGEAVQLPDGNHVHNLHSATDFTRGHFHTIDDKTGPAIPMGDGKHVHYAKGESSHDAEHLHAFKFATLIDDPTGV